MRLPMILLSLMLSTAAFAKGDFREIKMARDGRFEIDHYILGGPELIGYLGEIHETEGVDSVVLGGRFTSEQESRFSQLVRKAGVKPFVKEGRTRREAGSAEQQP